MNDTRPHTPAEIRESRRAMREWGRWFAKHYGNCSEKGANAFVAVYRAWLKFISKVKHLGTLTQLLKALALVPKFYNGLISNSLADTVPAPALN